SPHVSHPAWLLIRFPPVVHSVSLESNLPKPLPPLAPGPPRSPSKFFRPAVFEIVRRAGGRLWNCARTARRPTPGDPVDVARRDTRCPAFDISASDNPWPISRATGIVAPPASASRPASPAPGNDCLQNEQRETRFPEVFA